MQLTSSQVGALDNFGAALRALRLRRGIASQGELAALSGVALTTVNKIETGKRRPDFDTAGALLDAMKCTLHDLAHELDAAAGRAPAERRGKARPEWVSALAARGLDRDALWGFALGAIDRGDDVAAADFVASVEAAAREIAKSALAEAQSVREPLAMVAERPVDYGGSDARRSKRRRE
jgi:transcriptional regulator with XRE-family HTH domain